MIKRIKKMDKKKLIPMGVVGLITIVIAIVVIINLLFVKDDLKSFSFSNEKVYINFGEERFDFTGNISMDDKDNVANVTIDGKETKLFSEPIYYKKKDQIILPTPYSVVFPKSSGRQFKVNYFTMVKKSNDNFYLKNNDLSTNVNNTFLFDGSDYYIFLNDSVVSFGDNEIEIGSMSYVNYIYDTKELYIYDYNDKKIYYFEDVTGNVFVSNDLYKVNLKSDTLEINGKNKLLMKNFDYLKKLK